MFYNFSFSEYFVAVKQKLKPEPVPIVNVNNRSSIGYPNNLSVVNYTQNGEIIFCFKGLESAWEDI